MISVQRQPIRLLKKVDQNSDGVALPENEKKWDENQKVLDKINAKIEQYIPSALQDKEFVKIAEFFDKYCSL